jgi:hypothetical protein
VGNCPFAAPLLDDAAAELVAAEEADPAPLGVVAAPVGPASVVGPPADVIEAASGDEFPPQAVSTAAPKPTPPPTCRKRLRLTVDSLIADLLFLVKT